MSRSLVVDTNVGVVANRAHPQADLPCVSACIAALSAARTGIVLIDDRQRILDEYRRHLSLRDNRGSATPSSSGCGTTRAIAADAARYP